MKSYANKKWISLNQSTKFNNLDLLLQTVMLNPAELALVLSLLLIL